ncbi:hypothetical protein [Pseudozobellia sp. WGM2]|uniref:hypothetical protein n=1 Tax=Pseudozobellia sp. WGM2 TaxID=2787625 RepID=UPI001AE03D11|nr:hypothetical protein [Pseudozobellia sp. WGM2]
MKKFLLKVSLSLLFVFLCDVSYSQVTEIAVKDSANVVNKRLKFGCGFGLSFVGGTNIGLSPNLMYAVSNKMSIGAGLQGNYTAIKDVQSTTTIGANIIGQYSPTPKLTTLLEFAELNVNTKQETVTGDIKDNFWESILFVGAGLNITNKIALGVKYNVLYKEDESVYTSPVIPFVNITF